MKAHYLLLIAFLGFGLHNPTQLKAQTNDLSALKPLEGEWKGGGWIKMPSSETVQFNQHEVIEFKLSDQVLLINGKGYHKESGSLEFEALAMLYQDKDGNIKMTTHTNDNKHTEAEAELGDGTLDWWFALPNGGTIKYEIVFDDTDWQEKGSYSPDGSQWYPFMEMTLKKQ